MRRSSGRQVWSRSARLRPLLRFRRWRPECLAYCEPAYPRDEAVPDEYWNGASVVLHDATVAAETGVVAAPGIRRGWSRMWRATRAASRPVPAISIEVNEWRNSRPTK